jgi:hypothetical protein
MAFSTSGLGIYGTSRLSTKMSAICEEKRVHGGHGVASLDKADILLTEKVREIVFKKMLQRTGPLGPEECHPCDKEMGPPVIVEASHVKLHVKPKV